jgi:hypothetical protein
VEHEGGHGLGGGAVGLVDEPGAKGRGGEREVEDGLVLFEEVGLGGWGGRRVEDADGGALLGDLGEAGVSENLCNWTKVRHPNPGATTWNRPQRR